MFEFFNLLNEIYQVFQIKLNVFGFVFSYQQIYYFSFISIVVGYVIGAYHK